MARALSALVLLAALLAAERTGEPGPKLRWLVAASAPPDSPLITVATEPYMARLERAAGVRIARRWGGTGGDEATMVEGTSLGRIQLTFVSAGALVRALPSIGVFDVPHLFEDYPSMVKRTRLPRLERPSLEAELKKAHLSFAAGPFFAGWRSISSTRPIRMPADLRGLRVRSQASPIQLAMWRTLGATPLETDMREVALALRSRSIDAIDLPPLWLFATSAAGEVKHFTPTRHILQAAFGVFHRETFEALPPPMRARVREIIEEAVLKACEVSDQLERELVELLPRQAIEVHPLDARARDAWRAAMAPVATQAGSLGPAARELLDAIRAP